MKSKSNIFAIFLVMCLIGHNTSLAQATCPHPIINNLNCSVTIDWIVYDAACVQICSGTGVVINPGQTVNVGGACCASFYEIYIIITDIGGTPNGTAPNTPASGQVNGLCAPTTSSSTGGCSSSCQPSAAYSITWGMNGASIQ